jgi:NAD(P)-dependent dehydrogenase (short-subunit alcohol dehydrogenase family)
VTSDGQLRSGWRAAVGTLRSPTIPRWPTGWATPRVRSQRSNDGCGLWSAVCDVTSPSSVADLVDQCCTQIGVPTALFNNAGYQGVFAPLHRYPAHDAQQVFDVNIFGAFVVLHSVAQRMVDNGGGSIVSTASMAGVSGAPNMAAYSASKAAIVAMTKSAAKDLAPHGIRVNAISPAFIGPGRMWDNQVARQAAAGSQYFPTETAEVAAQMISSIPMRRVGSVDEVAAVVDFLLSADASYVTGQNIEISGGSI